jgi:HPt (histidine-containing phosphotransfer) domain-containing protein
VNDEALDRRTIRALHEYGVEPGTLLQELLEDFLTEAPSLMADIDRSVEQGACPAVVRAAHQLNGMSGHMGAFRLALAAGELETSARIGVPEMMAAAAAARSELDLAMAAAERLQSP